MLNGVPLLAIIDPAGTIAYYHSDYQQPEETAIVEALKKIDPRFTRLTRHVRLAQTRREIPQLAQFQSFLTSR
jgi:hypothetical protein